MEDKEINFFSPILDTLSSHSGCKHPADSIFFNAVQTFGSTNQKWVAVEEMAELTKEISKCYREGTEISISLIEEFADVCICMAQLELIIRCSDDYGRKKIEAAIDRKITRLNDKIDEHTNKLGNG